MAGMRAVLGQRAADFFFSGLIFFFPLSSSRGPCHPCGFLTRPSQVQPTLALRGSDPYRRSLRTARRCALCAVPAADDVHALPLNARVLIHSSSVHLGQAVLRPSLPHLCRNPEG